MTKNYEKEEYNILSAFELVDYQLKAMHENGEESIIFQGAKMDGIAKDYLVNYGLIKPRRPENISFFTIIYISDVGYKVLNNYKNFEEYYNEIEGLKKIQTAAIKEGYELTKEQREDIRLSREESKAARRLSIIAIIVAIVSVIVALFRR